MKKLKTDKTMGNMIRYKGYYAIPQYSAPDQCFYGNLSGIQDCIMFEGRNVDELENAFRNAVDDYLDQCRIEGIEPQKPFSGKFNLRMPPELHARTAQIASRLGISVNQFIIDTLEKSIR